MWEVTFFKDYGSAKTVYWSTKKAIKHFGREEFEEIKQGYAPHIVAVKVGDWEKVFDS